MAEPLAMDRDAIARLCRQYGVHRMVVFGSAVTESFDELRSDVDFLVEFDEGIEDRFAAYFGLKESLETLLGRPVDLVAAPALKNPYFAASLPWRGPDRSCMQPDAPALLWDAREAARLISMFIEGRSWQHYQPTRCSARRSSASSRSSGRR
jgi:predicted nucleotidyltransferase